jgi:cell division protein ZapA (FtsZ GTPase activity inhibitor)
MTAVKRTITLEIAGTKFRLVSDAEEAQLQELADLVNERVAQLGSGSRASSAQLLALAALGLADSLKTAEHRLERVERLTRGAIATAIARIDSRIARDAAGGEAE